MLLIHGAFTTNVDWPDAIIDPLALDHHVLAIDRPGHGQSRRVGRSGDSRLQAKIIAEALSHLDEPAIIVAHSFGALTALAYAHMFPGRTAGLVLAGPVCAPEWRLEQAHLLPRALPFVGPALSAAANLAVDGAYIRFIQLAMFAPQAPPDAWLRRYPMDAVHNPQAFVREAEDSAAVSPLWPGAYFSHTQLKPPVRILQGSADLILPGGWHARLLAMLAPDASIEWASGVGHMVHQICPGRIVEAVHALRKRRPQRGCE